MNFRTRLWVTVISGLVAAGVIASAAIIGSLPYTLTNGSTADATQVMANYQKIIDDCNANCAKNGVNSDITALTALSTPLTAAQGGTRWYEGGTSTGSANAQTVGSVTPTGMTLAAGQGICFNAGFTNTGATTLVANALTAKNVFRQSPSGNQALTGGEIVASSRTCAQYDGTQYVLTTPGYLAPGVGPLTNLASASTTDLGTIASHNVNITGTTGITAFGSSASATFPEYQLTFAGALTITYNASSMITPGAGDITTVANSTAVAVYLGSGNWRIKSYTPYTGTGQLQGVQVFTAGGTWTRPARVSSALFICVGSGGAGGGAANSGANAGSSGGGGGSGSWGQKFTTSPASTYTITINAGGTGVSNGTGNSGGSVSVGALLSCTGGAGGTASVTSTTGTAAAGGTGGAAGGSGDINIPGNPGAPGLSATSGSSVIQWALGGQGGNSYLGAGAPATLVASVAAANAGTAATGCGGGGSGATVRGASGDQAGGAGAAGCVIAYSYY